MLKRGLFVAAGLWLASHSVAAAEIQIAVASNFSKAAEALAARYEELTDHRVTLVMGSTGKHYAQIRNGAPFDVFLAADQHRPAKLDEEGLAVTDSRFTYARGLLVLWSPSPTLVDSEGQILQTEGFRFLAMAHPDLAPYGQAAAEVLDGLDLEAALRGRIVRGENIGQTFQFVSTGNADLGFVAWSQIVETDQREEEGSYWLVPQELYSPIDQQAVLLSDTRAASEFLAFVQTEEARQVIQQHGYLTP